MLRIFCLRFVMLTALYRPRHPSFHVGLFLLVIWFCVFAVLHTDRGRNSPSPERSGEETVDDHLSAECPKRNETRRLLLVLKTKLGAHEVRNHVRRQVASSPQCRMNVTFVFGNLEGPSGTKWSKALSAENKTTGDILVIDSPNARMNATAVVYDIRDNVMRTCQSFEQIVFGVFETAWDRIKSDLTERQPDRSWELDSCLKFTQRRWDNVNFIAHYFAYNDGTVTVPKLYSLHDTPVSDYNFSISTTRDKNLCHERHTDHLAIVAVHTAPDGFLNRKLIRQTWASAEMQKKYRFMVLFFMGTNYSSGRSQIEKLRKEMDTHGDMVQLNFRDSYKNMTLKQISVLKYLSTFCYDVNYTFLLKTDDDIIFDMPLALQLVQNQVSDRRGGAMDRSVVCFHMNEISKVPRYGGKWNVDLAEYPDQLYPAYCSGAGYFITKDLIELLYETSLHVKSFWVDDTFVTGILPMVIGNITIFQLRKQFPILNAEQLLPKSLAGESIPRRGLYHLNQNMELYSRVWSLLLRNPIGRLS